MKTNFSGRIARPVIVVTAVLSLGGNALAEEPCGLCDKEIVTNGTLATCFLENYQAYADKADGAVVVDLSNCEASRGVVEALPAPKFGAEDPDVKFIVSRSQLDCLKQKLEDPKLVLDPSATIELDSCG